MHKNIAQTSIEAYRQINADGTGKTSRQKVAEYVIWQTKRGQTCWINSIAVALKMRTSSVSARLNELRKHGAHHKGLFYNFVFVKQQKDPATKKTVNCYAAQIKRIDGAND